MSDYASNKPVGALIWDLPTRLFHWALVLCVTGAFFSQWFYERIPFLVHEIFGVSALVLIAFRLAWGFIGSRYARFSAFLRGPAETLAYVRAVFRRAPPKVIGHTPTGGWMIVALLLLVGTQASLGLFSNDDTDSAGFFYGWVSHATSKQLTELHEVIGDLLLIAIGIHVVAVVVYKFVLREDLIRTLWTGRNADAPISVSIPSQQIITAILLLALFAGAILWLIKIAPAIPNVLM
jgi:cytochrome b